MKSKLAVPQSTPNQPGARRSPEVGQKLKSERVQLEFQLVPSQSETLRALAQRGTKVPAGATVTLFFDPADPTAGPASGTASGARVEAGSAFGTPGQNDQPSTHGKEEDHEDTQNLR